MLFRDGDEMGTNVVIEGGLLVLYVYSVCRCGDV